MWKQFRDSNYRVSDQGQIKNKDGRVMKARVNCGYMQINLHLEKGTKGKNFMVHRLVAQIFIPNPEEKPYVNHKDGNRVNNKADNLEWVTHSENIRHKFDCLNSKTNARPVLQLDLKENVIAQYTGLTEASKETGASISNIYKCCNGRQKTSGSFKWTYVHENQPVDLTDFTPIPGFENRYLINRKGDIYTTKTKRLLKSQNSGGYRTVQTNEKGKLKLYRVHNLMAKTFLDPPPEDGKKYIVNHKDFSRSNNLVENLEWLTLSENNQHYWDNTNRKKILKIFPDHSIEIYKSSNEAAHKNGVNSQYITCTCSEGRTRSNGVKYRYISDDFYEKLVSAMKEIKIYFH